MQSIKNVLAPRVLVLFCVLFLTGCLQMDVQDALSQSRGVSAQVDAAGASQIVVDVGAGDLTVVGQDGTTDVTVSGTAYARSDEDLDRVRLIANRDGDVVRIRTDIPRNVRGRIDLEMTLPQGVNVEIEDSSGDAEVRGLSGERIDVEDSSGDLSIQDVSGALNVEDSSGGLRIRGVVGDVTIEDSSGDIEVENVQGRLEIDDSSGDIDVRSIEGDVVVDDDSSGNIEARDVTGSVRVVDDSSGDIRVDGVGGDFIVEDDGSGSIQHRNVEGTVRIPEDR